MTGRDCAQAFCEQPHHRTSYQVLAAATQQLRQSADGQRITAKWAQALVDGNDQAMQAAAKEGECLFGEEGFNALAKELQKLHKKDSVPLLVDNDFL